MKKKFAIGLAAFVLVLGGGIFARNQMPKLASYVDEDGVVEIQEEETPLARSFFVDLDDQITIDEDEVPLAKSFLKCVSIVDTEGSIEIEDEDVPL